MPRRNHRPRPKQTTNREPVEKKKPRPTAPKVVVSEPAPASTGVDLDDRAHAANKRAWHHYLSRPCRRHKAKPGRTCWEYPVALCGSRVGR